MKLAASAALLAAGVLAGCGGSGQVPRTRAAVELRQILGAKPAWIRLARVEGGKLAWLGFSPHANPRDRECLPAPCAHAHKPSPVAAYVDAQGKAFEGWADVPAVRPTASPAAVVRAMSRREPTRLASASG